MHEWKIQNYKWQISLITPICFLALEGNIPFLKLYTSEQNRIGQKKFYVESGVMDMILSLLLYSWDASPCLSHVRYDDIQVNIFF